ncbi:hypothetical protein OG782_17775 [Streptomyces sp. NBC_00876]|uniref:hypothetical protein n=1 Tax=Streptomyces sp. NBC_00876 TaxID=2975853 RepID=UPI0038666455|nr:hypothetical protein OG782_17775 [Streptomyces sp. NBC_00876]
MSGLRKRWYVRGAAAGAAALLLAGCGAADSGAGAGEDAKAAWIDQSRMRTVLPDAQAMPGWTTTGAASTTPMTDRMTKNLICPNKSKTGCERARFLGSVTFRRDDDKAEARFWVVTYQEEQDADFAYDSLWKDTWSKNGTRNVDIGTVGAERGATGGTAGRHAEGFTAQVRVGTVILWVGGSAATDAKGVADPADKDFAKDATAMFAERAQQAQNGEEPSAALAAA